MGYLTVLVALYPRSRNLVTLAGEAESPGNLHVFENISPESVAILRQLGVRAATGANWNRYFVLRLSVNAGREPDWDAFVGDIRAVAAKHGMRME